AALPWTLGLVGIATILSFFLGSGLGAIIGWRRGSKADAIGPISTLFSTVPYFWMGLIAIAVFSSMLGWFPASHAYSKGASPEWSWEFVWDVVQHGTLPALTIVVASLGGWVLGMRNMMITVLDEDYVTVAQAKGLPPRKVL
ncbi:ABC transporter permease, partial [Streptomyces sp. SID13726]|uniref:ABC transporter permease n=1 Tax=Streptomyces sp. SID13726 TaxID=2706058 RepID=UPI0013BB2A37